MINNASNYFNEDYSNLELDIIKSEDMSDLEKFKIKIVNTYQDLYKKFPTLHLITCTYYSTKAGLAEKGWNARVSQVAWDKVENIRQEEDYKKENLIMYAYLNNKNNIYKKESIFPMKNGDIIIKINYDELISIVKNEFSYLNQMGIDLKNQLVFLQENKNNSPSINLASKNFWGEKADFKKEVYDFFGKDMTINMNYLKMNESLPDKPVIKAIKKTKI